VIASGVAGDAAIVVREVAKLGVPDIPNLNIETLQFTAKVAVMRALIEIVLTTRMPWTDSPNAILFPLVNGRRCGKIVWSEGNYVSVGAIHVPSAMSLCSGDRS
jgi:hypothetical protein